VHDNIVPHELNKLLNLPGVGMKMALLLQQSAFDIVEGISVDTHVHRISNLLNWVSSKNPDQTRDQLQKWVPKDKWKQINHLLVGFGQTICKPVAPL
jgi:endonuclease III